VAVVQFGALTFLAECLNICCLTQGEAQLDQRPRRAKPDLFGLGPEQGTHALHALGHAVQAQAGSALQHLATYFGHS
jgi:hypothetical protein